MPKRERVGKNEAEILKYAFKVDKRKDINLGITTDHLRWAKVLPKDKISRGPLDSLARKGFLRKTKYYANYFITAKGIKKVKEMKK